MRKGNDPIIHVTFLDTFVQNGSENIYGAGAQYAEHYVNLEILLPTNAELFFAYNFDITGLPHTPDPNDPVGHSWPVKWYLQSIGSSRLSIILAFLYHLKVTTAVI